MDTKGTRTLSSLELLSGSLCVPGGRRSNAASMSTSRGTSLLFGSNQYESISTVDRSCPSRTSHAKTRAFLYSIVGLVKDRVVYWVTQITLMRGSGFSIQTNTGGL